MPRESNTGVRGLTVAHVPCEGACVYKAAGKRCPKQHPIYSVGFRRVDPERGVERYRERLPDGTTLREATEHAFEVSKRFAAGDVRPRREQSRSARVAAGELKKLSEVCDDYLEWAAIERPKTIENRRQHCKQFREFFGDDRLVSAITPDDVKRFKVRVQTEGKRRRSNGTVNRSLATLFHLVMRAADNGWLSVAAAGAIRSVPMLEESGERERYLTAEEQERLLAVLPDDFRDFVHVALCTGMRLSEINGLRWSEVDFVDRVLRLPRGRTKQKKPHTLPMLPELETLLSRRATNRVSAVYVFPGEDGEQPRARKAMTATFRRYASKAGLAATEELPRFRFHDLRHTVATRLTATDVPLGVVAQVLGHSQVSTTQRYAHSPDATKRQAMGRLRIVEAPKPAHTDDGQSLADSPSKDRPAVGQRD